MSKSRKRSPTQKKPTSASHRGRAAMAVTALLATAPTAHALGKMSEQPGPKGFQAYDVKPGPDEPHYYPTGWTREENRPIVYNDMFVHPGTKNSKGHVQKNGFISFPIQQDVTYDIPGWSAEERLLARQYYTGNARRKKHSH